MYALLVTELRETEDGALDSSASSFLEKTQGIASSIGAESKLARGCWLLNLQTHLPQFSTLLRQASESRVPYKVAFFEKEPTWCSSK